MNGNLISLKLSSSSFAHPLGAPGEVAEDVVTGTMTVMQGTCDGCAFLGFFVILSCQFAKHLF